MRLPLAYVETLPDTVLIQARLSVWEQLLPRLRLMKSPAAITLDRQLRQDGPDPRRIRFAASDLSALREAADG